ncbi:MAG: prepilin-type N-terminal cleavage/methylation domain-containing protein [Methylococcales bacterium]|nr:prepilin-type N-terminal cleavage/methylation domain-containing protein [Methylococcales bacterium]
MKIKTLLTGINSIKQSGFSLIELLVVLVIAAMLLTTVPPMFSSGVSSSELKGTARSLAAALRSARSRSITTQKPTQLIINVEQKFFTVPGKDKQYKLPKDMEIKLKIAGSEQQDNETGSFRFFPDGSSTGGRVVIAYDERKYQIDIDWLTGDVVIAN